MPKRKRLAERIKIFERQKRIEKMILSGVTSADEIGHAFGVSTSVVKLDIQGIYKRWRDDASTDEESQILKIKRVRQMEKLYLEVMNAWEQSKRTQEEFRLEIRQCDNCGGSKEVVIAGKMKPCPQCKGKGAVEVELRQLSGIPGDPSFINQARLLLVELAKMEGNHPSTSSSAKELLVATRKSGAGQDAIEELFISAPVEVLLQAKKLMEDLEMAERPLIKGQVKVVNKDAK